MDGWMDILSFAGGYSLGLRHLALAAQRPNLLHVQTSAYGHRTATPPPPWWPLIRARRGTGTGTDMGT